jgi:putative transposase
MRRNYKYILKVSTAQAESIDRWMESLRLLYNYSLADRREAFQNGKKINYYDQARELKDLKKQFPRYKEVNAQALQQCLGQLERSFKAFFEKRSSYPKFKAKDRAPSICFPQGTRIEGKYVKFSKLGKIRFKQHRPLPDGAVIKQSRIVKEVGRYYVVLSLELPEPTVSVPPVNVVGCDIGVKHLATLSDGVVIDGEQALKKNLERLAAAQRKLSKKKTGSNNRKKQKSKVLRIHRKISNQRRDFLHKVSAELAETYDAIAFEKMNLGFINQNKSFKTARKSHDIGIGTFREFCEYKFAERGKRVFHVDPKNTTKECSDCGCLVNKDLNERTHLCPACGLKLDRDVNAAINIRSRALSGLGQPVEPVKGKIRTVAKATVGSSR